METICKDKFLILKTIKNFILDLEKILLTFPKKDMLSRQYIYEDSLGLLELIIKANYETDSSFKHKYQIEAMSKVSKLDFYLERAYKLGYINEKQCSSKKEVLLRVNKMIFAWCRNEE